MRLPLRLITSLLLLPFAVLIALQLAAHWQIRQVTPALPTSSDLRGLLMQPGAPARVRFINTSRQSSPRGDVAMPAIIIEWPDGKLFMLDAGMDKAAAAQFGKLLEWMWDAQPAEPLLNVAQALGSNIEQVRGVGFTHLHSDHTQGIEPFCAARDESVRAFQSPDQNQRHNLHTRAGAKQLRNSCLDIAVTGERDGHMTMLDGFPGLAMVPLGGHTPGSTLFAVALNGKLLLFAGDICNTRASLLGDKGKPFYYSYLLLPEHAPRNAKLRRWLRELDDADDMIVLLAHDLAHLMQTLEPYTPTAQATISPNAPTL